VKSSCDYLCQLAAEILRSKHELQPILTESQAGWEARFVEYQLGLKNDFDEYFSDPHCFLEVNDARGNTNI
jgi:hypothetical protein